MYLLKLTFSFSIWTGIRSSHPEVFLGKGVLKICSKFTGEHPCRSAISIKLLCNFIEITFRHGCSPVNLQHIFRTPFLKDTSGTLLLRNVIIMNYFLLVEVVDFHNNIDLFNSTESKGRVSSVFRYWFRTRHPLRLQINVIGLWNLKRRYNFWKVIVKNVGNFILIANKFPILF